jgi:hypothetical protein
MERGGEVSFQCQKNQPSLSDFFDAIVQINRTTALKPPDSRGFRSATKLLGYVCRFCGSCAKERLISNREVLDDGAVDYSLEQTKDNTCRNKPV